MQWLVFVNFLKLRSKSQLFVQLTIKLTYFNLWQLVGFPMYRYTFSAVSITSRDLLIEKKLPYHEENYHLWPWQFYLHILKLPLTHRLFFIWTIMVYNYQNRYLGPMYRPFPNFSESFPVLPECDRTVRCYCGQFDIKFVYFLNQLRSVSSSATLQHFHVDMAILVDSR